MNFFQKVFNYGIMTCSCHVAAPPPQPSSINLVFHRCFSALGLSELPDKWCTVLLSLQVLAQKLLQLSLSTLSSSSSLSLNMSLGPSDNVSVHVSAKISSAG
jgi:hypothetical protein